MKKSIIFLILVFVLAFVSFRQTNCYASKTHRGYKEFIEQLSNHSGIYTIKDKWDLSIDKIKVKCSDKVSIGGEVYYCSKKTVRLKPGQILIIPTGCYLVSNTHKSILGENEYETDTDLTGYLACREIQVQTCFVTKKILLPPNSVLRFSNGTIANGVIDMAGGFIESDETHILDNCILSNLGNKRIYGRWFFNDNQKVSTKDFEIFNNIDVDFGNLRLYANDVIRVPNAHWCHLNLTAPQIIIGSSTPLKSDFPIWKTSSKVPTCIETNDDLSTYKNHIVLLSFAEPVHYDWREINGRPTLYRGVASLIEGAKLGSFVIEDTVEVFGKDYSYKASDGSQAILKSQGYIYPTCRVVLDNCTFYSTKRIESGFMYIFSGKDLIIRDCSWLASSEGTPSLLGINNSVNGVVERCLFRGAFYAGTQTSYGLQTINSTRIIIKDCILEGNRRGVDFSGNLCQSRYCVVENCRVVGRIIEHEGSGLGGHSTSYGNIYRNNIIEGSSSCAGIQTRGDNEIIEGNILNLPFSAAAISCAENTTIRNNICDNGKTSTFVWIESISKEGNTITVENNKFKGNNLVRGQEQLTCKVVIKGNTFEYSSTVSSFAPTGNDVTVTSYNNKISRGNKKAVLYYKYNPQNNHSKAESLGIKDRVEFSVDKAGVVTHE